MLLLVTDTSGRNGSVALARAGESSEEVQLLESTPLAGGTFSAQLVPQIATLLHNHGFSKADIGAFIVVSGPGSFTGLRVGLAAIKGLAEILGKPIVAVSLLEVLAIASNRAGKVIAALDAGRNEIYAGEYEFQENAARLLRESLVPRAELLSGNGTFAISTTDASIAEMARLAGIHVVALQTISIEMIASLGWKKLQTGQTLPPEILDANYIRRTVAEIYPKPASSS